MIDGRAVVLAAEFQSGTRLIQWNKLYYFRIWDPSSRLWNFPCGM